MSSRSASELPAISHDSSGRFERYQLRVSSHAPSRATLPACLPDAGGAALLAFPIQPQRAGRYVLRAPAATPTAQAAAASGGQCRRHGHAGRRAAGDARRVPEADARGAGRVRGRLHADAHLPRRVPGHADLLVRAAPTGARAASTAATTTRRAARRRRQTRHGSWRRCTVAARLPRGRHPPRPRCCCRRRCSSTGSDCRCAARLP